MRVLGTRGQGSIPCTPTLKKVAFWATFFVLGEEANCLAYVRESKDFSLSALSGRKSTRDRRARFPVGLGSRLRLKLFRQKVLSSHRRAVLRTRKTCLRRSTLLSRVSQKSQTHGLALLFTVRDRRVELLTTVWKTVVLPIN
jgi:hypothetical protein